MLGDMQCSILLDLEGVTDYLLKDPNGIPTKDLNFSSKPYDAVPRCEVETNAQEIKHNSLGLHSLLDLNSMLVGLYGCLRRAQWIQYKTQCIIATVNSSIQNKSKPMSDD